MAGIVRWALEGAKRIQENNFIFTENKATRAMQTKFKEHLSSAVLFFNEQCVHGSPLDFFSAEMLYTEYQTWIKQRGKKQQSYYSFVRDIDEGCQPKVTHNYIDGFTVKLKSNIFTPIPTF